MAEDKNEPEDNLDTPGDSGLGNLPPLSDFDSGGMDSDGGLPPLGNFDSGGTPSDSAGLPPISDIQVETPQPTGGNVKPKPPGFDSAVTDTFSSGTPGIDTPAGHTPSEGMSPVGSGFQDLAADSDFSPETPEIGPGPDSNVDTPMFDSAFGGGSGSGFGSGTGTGAPTQAMETPMFGQGGGGDQPGFDAGAFGGGGGSPSFAAGTPAPDFSPDTDMRAPMGGMPAASEPSGGKGGSPLALVIAAVIALIIGIVAGPYAADKLGFLPNPSKAKLAEAESNVTRLNGQVSKLQDDLKQYIDINPDDVQNISPEALEQLKTDIQAASAELAAAESQLSEKSSDLARTEEELSEKNLMFVARNEEFETLQNQFSITEARQRGLSAEVERLTNQVGQLEDADARRAATKEALGHAVDRLYIQIKEGLPLTPEKYDRNARIAEVETLRDQVAGAKWVAPALQEAYTNLYLKELAISQSQEYFFSKIPVIDAYGSRVTKWAECVMNGNHSVNYRTFDGKNIGTFTNQGTGEDPAWGFMEDLSPAAKTEIENKIVANRVEGFEQKIQALAERQVAMDGDSGFQKAFSSL